MPSMKEIQSGKKQDNRGKIHFTSMGTRLGGCLFLFYVLMLNACTNNSLTQKLQAVKPLLKSGDIIVRSGNDEVSEAARSFNRKDKTYSHCGIIQIENDSVFVYHALGGIYNPSQKLLRQPVALFCNPDDVDQFAVYRYPLTQVENKQLSNWINEKYRTGLLFDYYFNFYTDNRMYCSEFVFKALNTATGGAFNKFLHENEEPLYIAIDDLYLNDAVREIVKIE